MSPSRASRFKRGWVFWILDILIIVISFLFIAKLKPATVRIVLPKYSDPFYIFMIIWSFVSLAIGKYHLISKLKRKDYFLMILISNAAITGLVSFIIYYFGVAHYSRLMVFGTIGFATLLEVVFTGLYTYFLKLNRRSFYYEGEPIGTLFDVSGNKKREKNRLKDQAEKSYTYLDESLVEASSREFHDLVAKFCDINSDQTFIASTSTLFNIQKLRKDYYTSIINLKRINDLRHINTFFASVNERLPEDGIYILSAETAQMRIERIKNKYPVLLNYVALGFDYLLKRVAPKLKLTRGIYFLLTRGQNRALTKVEILGRLYYAGFEILHEQQLDKLLYFVMRKKSNPKKDQNPSYGPLIRLQRHGKDGKEISVYKFRTMYPYSEYLQEYAYRMNELQKGGKIKDDFRVSPLGKILRKVWLDEFPMIINLLRGELKIVGVRPLSKHYFSLYSEELKEKRTRVKPGLIPPFYVDMPNTLDEIQDSEMRYLNAYMNRPVKTDWNYFWRALNNIAIKRARSA